MPTIEDYYNDGARFLLKVMASDVNDINNEGRITVNISFLDFQYAINHGEKNFELSFELEPLRVKDNVMITMPVHAHDRLVVFEGTEDLVRVDLWVVPYNKPPLIYPKIRINHGTQYNNEINNYLLLRPQFPGTTINKRTSYRVATDIPCKVSVGKHKDTFQAILRDVCTEGFCIEVSDSVTQKAEPTIDTINVNFVDEGVSKSSIDVSGLCVRKASKHGSVIYGCHSPFSPKNFKSYVMSKQAKKMGAATGSRIPKTRKTQHKKK